MSPLLDSVFQGCFKVQGRVCSRATSIPVCREVLELHLEEAQPCRASRGLWVLRGLPLKFLFFGRFGSIRGRGHTQFCATLPQGRALLYCSDHCSTAIAAESRDGRPEVAFCEAENVETGFLWQLLFRSNLSKQRP